MKKGLLTAVAGFLTLGSVATTPAFAWDPDRLPLRASSAPYQHGGHTYPQEHRWYPGYGSGHGGYPGHGYRHYPGGHGGYPGHGYRPSPWGSRR